jgi:hypothetical protein
MKEISKETFEIICAIIGIVIMILPIVLLAMMLSGGK